MAKIAVIGAGVVGLSVATTLRLNGHDIVLIDRDEPGRGCSFGNAGIIATSYVEPLSSFETLLRVPKLALDPAGPLTIRPRDIGRLLPWLFRFTVNALPSRQARNLSALKALNQSALRAWRRLLADVGVAGLLVERGVIEIIRRPSGMRSLRAKANALKHEGLDLELIDAEDVLELEPFLAEPICAGIYYRDMAHVANPYRLSKALFGAFTQSGGVFCRDEVISLRRSEGGLKLTGRGGTKVLERVVVCGGLWSADILESLGKRAPLVAERGYHLNFDDLDVGLNRPVGFHEEAVFATPMVSGLRLAGTVELARPTALPNWMRAEIMRKVARPSIPAIPEIGGTPWMGSRPSFPDSLPAIGRLADAGIFYAFGHQHLGLTQAAVTAEMVAAMVAGREPSISVDPYSLDRFDG